MLGFPYRRELLIRAKAAMVTTVAIVAIFALWQIGKMYGGRHALDKAHATSYFPVSISAESLALGEVPSQCEFKHVLLAENLTDQTVELQIRPDCSCMTVPQPQIKLPPHGKREIEATINLYRDGSPLSHAPKYFGTSFTTHVDGAEPQTWQIAGTVIPSIFIDAKACTISQLHGNEAMQTEWRVPFSVRGDIRNVVAKANGGIAGVEVSCVAENVLNLIVASRPNLPVGLHRDRISIEAVSREGDAIKLAELPLTIVVSPSVNVTPDVVLCTFDRAGDSKLVELVVASQSKRIQEVTIGKRSESDCLQAEIVDLKIGDGAKKVSLSICVGWLDFERAQSARLPLEITLEEGGTHSVSVAISAVLKNRQ